MKEIVGHITCAPRDRVVWENVVIYVIVNYFDNSRQHTCVLTDLNIVLIHSHTVRVLLEYQIKSQRNYLREIVVGGTHEGQTRHYDECLRTTASERYHTR